MGKKLKNNSKIFAPSPSTKSIKSKTDKTVEKPRKNNLYAPKQ
jgi:hypothetical protein